MAIETLLPDYNDLKGLKSATKEARADGFTGMFAVHPVQVAEINAAFAATEAEIDGARRLVEAYEAEELPGDLMIARRTIGDRQLLLARRMLGLDEPRDQGSARGPTLRPA